MSKQAKGMDKSKLLNKADQIWKMLDDMAMEDPAAYKKFIDQQMKAGKEAMKPPETHMCVQTMMLMPETSAFFINIFQWTKVPYPENDEAPIPVAGGPIYDNSDNEGTHKIISVAFNPEVLKTFGIDSKLVADRNLLINLAIDFIEHRNEVKLSRHFTLFDKDHVIHGCPEKAKQSLQGMFKNEEGELDADLKDIEKKFGPMASGCKDSFLSELSNISSDGQKSGSNDVPEITLNTSTKPTRQGLIEEVSSSEASITEPHYEVDTREGDSAKPRRLIVRIELPMVASVAECDLDISERDLQLTVEDKYSLALQFPEAVADNEAKAKFSRKSSCLTLILPTKVTR